MRKEGKRRAAAALVCGSMLAVALVGGTMAYLTDTDSDVNVMTLGNVKIEQIEQQWNGDKLEPFENDKPLYPYTGELGWDSYGDQPEYRQFAMNNVVDKYVSVKNIGESDAYVRTFIALEMGDYGTLKDFGESGIGLSINALDGAEFDFEGAWEWTNDFETSIDGKKYNVMVAVHKAAVKPGKTTIPSLLQVYLSKDATNEVVEKLDGNGDGKYNILAFSEAVQVEGFDNAQAALNAAFGNPKDGYHPWSNATIAHELGITEAGTYDLQGDIHTVDTGYFHTQSVTAPVTINGHGAVVNGTATSVDAFTWEGGTIPAMSPIFSSANGSKVTVNDMTFTGTMSSVMAGHYQNATYSNYDTEFNNVDIIDAEVVSFSAGISPALTAYGTLVMNDCNVYGTTLSSLDTDPMWPVYDVAAVNYSDVTINGSKIGSLYMWNQAEVTVADGSAVDTIVVAGNMNTSKYGLTVKAGATVDVIDLSNITNKTKINITIKDGAAVGKFVANGVEYASLSEWQSA